MIKLLPHYHRLAKNFQRLKRGRADVIHSKLLKYSEMKVKMNDEVIKKE